VVAVWFPRCIENDFPTVEILLRHSIAFQFIERKVNSVSLNVLTYIAKYVGQLHENTP
jgi:hypothetical protein